MTRIRCYYDDCVFLKNGLCNAANIELDPEDGCLTYSEDPRDLLIIDSIADEEDSEDDWESEGFEEIEDLELGDD